LSAADIQVQSGGIQANGNVQVKATDLLQTFRGTYLSGIEGLDLGATVIRSAGNLFTQANLRLQGSVLIENMGNIEVKGDAEIIAPLIQHGALGNVIQPSIFVAGNCRFQGNANIHDAQLKVGGTFKHGNLNVRSTEAEIRLAEEMRTNKKKSLRKKMRAICRMFISIPISYYTGGLFSGWLAGFGVGGVKLVAARGLVVGLSSSAIRGTNVVRGGLEGALFAGVGYGVTQVSFLKQQNEVIQEIARGMSVGALQTALHKGNLLENMVIAGLASGVGAALVPNLSADSGQSVRTDLNVLRAIVESSVATIASHSNKNLVINLASSAMGASFGQALSKIGNQQGYQAATKHKALPIVQSSNHTSNYKTPKPIQQRSKESPKLIQMKELLGLQTPKTPVGMVDNILQGRIKELEVAPKYKHQSTSSMGIKANQNIRDENSGQGFFPMWWRAIKGDQTQEVMNWQQRNIKRLPILNAMNEGIKKGTQISKMIVNARDAAFMPLLHPVDTVQGLAIFTWDMSGAASKLMFGSCTKGSSDRNSDRWRAIKQEYHQFDSGSLATKLEMINQVLLTGTLTMATGSVALLGVSNAVQITTRQGLKASQGMLKLYDANKVSQSLEFGAFKSGVLAETNFARNASVILSQKAVDKAPLIPAFDKFKSIPSVPVNKPLEQLAPKVHIKTKGIAEKQITDAGLSYPEPLLTHELPKVLSWQKHRNEYLKAQRELDVSGLPKKTQDLLIETSADNAIINRMLPDDIAGIFKEGRGVKIYSKINGRLLKHNMEGEQALRAIKTVIIDIKVRLKTLNDRRQINTIEVHLLEQKLSRLSKLKDNYSELMKDAKCLSGSNKLKP
jgi:hypothetical protein